MKGERGVSALQGVVFLLVGAGVAATTERGGATGAVVALLMLAASVHGFASAVMIGRRGESPLDPPGGRRFPGLTAFAPPPQDDDDLPSGRETGTAAAR